MDWCTFRKLAIHYLAMGLLLLVVTSILGAVAPSLDFWIFVVLAVAVGTLYPAAVHLLGIAPEPWQR